VGDILADPLARARTFGTDSVLATRAWTAVKTGTSKDMRDNWAIGWSSRYTVGVWVGNASGAPMHEVSGTSGAAPIWAALMAHLHARSPSRAPAAPAAPAALVRQPVRFGPAPGSAAPLEAARTEWFAAGTQQALFAIHIIADGDYLTDDRGGFDLNSDVSSAPSAVRIAAPAPGSIVALDPDIPPQHQRVHFIASLPSAPGLRWRMDGKPLGRGVQVAWLPWPGQHVVQLTDARGRVLDEVRIEVRGAGVKARAP